MATHSSILAWRISGMGELGGLPFMGSHRVGHDWIDLDNGPKIPGSYTILSFTALDFIFTTRYAHNWGSFPLCLSLFIFFGAISLIFSRGIQFNSIQSLSRVWLFATPWTAAHQASLFITNSRLLRLMSIESVMSYNHIILCLSLLLLPSIFLSIRVFSNDRFFAQVLEFQLQHQSFQWILSTDFL